MTISVEDRVFAQRRDNQQLRISANLSIVASLPTTLFLTAVTTSLNAIFAAAVETVGVQYFLTNLGSYDIGIRASNGDVVGTLVPGSTAICTWVLGSVDVGSWVMLGTAPAASTAVFDGFPGVSGSYAPGSFTLATERYLVVADHLTIGADETVTLSGTSTLVIL